MNNFNRIFSTIKKHCGERDSAKEAPLDQVEADVEIINGMNSIYQYLDVLQDLGLIVYSVHSNTISLTEKGKQTEKLFTV